MGKDTDDNYLLWLIIIISMIMIMIMIIISIVNCFAEHLDD